MTGPRLRLPPRVLLFRLRAVALARRDHDHRTRRAPLSIWRLSRLLALAHGRHRIVELGSAAGWTAYSLALANPGARVKTYDLAVRPGLSGHGRRGQLAPELDEERFEP